jgi:late competence protein required for DNA uptake (superfamily II DNA/RNA helicase)
MHAVLIEFVGYKLIRRSTITFQDCCTAFYRPKYNFVQEPEDDLKCIICSNVAEDPMQHVKCGKLFCKECLENEGRDQPCPSCKMDAEFYPDTRSEYK